MFWVSFCLLIKSGFCWNKWSTAIIKPIHHWNSEIKFLKNPMILYLLERYSEFRIRYKNFAKKLSHWLCYKFIVLWLAKVYFFVNSLSWLSLERCLSRSNFDH
jgi:hypothetical protein